jgi:predicted metal-dependent peptidase
MEFSKITGKWDPELIRIAKEKLTHLYCELSTNPVDGMRVVFSRMGGDPFLFQLMYPVMHEATNKIPTAATDGKRFLWNPKFLASLDPINVRLTQTHEGCHDLYMHPERLGSRDPKLWNYAVDYCVNNFSVEDIEARIKQYGNSNNAFPVRNAQEAFAKCGGYITLHDLVAEMKNPFKNLDAAEYIKNMLDKRHRNMPSVFDDRDLTAEEDAEIQRRQNKLSKFFVDFALPENLRRPESIYSYLEQILPRCKKCGKIGKYKMPADVKQKLDEEARRQAGKSYDDLVEEITGKRPKNAPPKNEQDQDQKQEGQDKQDSSKNGSKPGDNGEEQAQSGQNGKRGKPQAKPGAGDQAEKGRGKSSLKKRSKSSEDDSQGDSSGNNPGGQQSGQQSGQQPGDQPGNCCGDSCGEDGSNGQSGSQGGSKGGSQPGSQSGSPCCGDGQNPGDCQGGCGDSGCGGSGQPGDCDGSESCDCDGNGQGQGKSQGGGCGGCGDSCDECDGDFDFFDIHGNVDVHLPSQSDEKETAKRFADASIFASKNAGRTPSGIQEEIGDLQKPVMTWQDVIRFATKRVREGVGKNDWTRFRSRPMAAGMLLPKKVRRLARIAAFVDCSGSMDIRNDITYGLSQLQSLKDDADGFIIPCDAAIYYDQAQKIDKFSKEEIEKFQAVGRGGTAFVQEAIDTYEKEIGEIDILVFITDGYLFENLAAMTPPPRSKIKNIIWVVTSHAAFHVPEGWGRVFHIRNERL